jgi:hypothetical protein
MKNLIPSSLVLLLAGFVAGCSGPPTAPSVTPPVTAAAILPPAFLPPSFSVAGVPVTNCGSPAENAAWSLTMQSAGSDGATFHSVVTHSGAAGCAKTGEDRRVDDALIGVTGPTSYAPNGSGATDFVYHAGAFSCGSSEIVITLTAPDGRLMATVLDTLINYGVTCGVTPPRPPTPEPAPSPAPPPPPPGPGPNPTPYPLTLSISASTVQLGTSTRFTATATGTSGASAYTWSFGDGTSGTSTTPTTGNTYAAIGSYSVTAVLTDGAGRTATASTTATVIAVPPPPPPPPPPTPAGLVVTLTCVPAAHGSPTACNVAVSYNSVALPATAITSVAWEWGDGQTSATAPLGQNTYAQAGTYLVVATVTATTVDGPKTAARSRSLIIS